MVKVAYILTPIDFGGVEKVTLNFLKNVNKDKYQIVPIVLIRPWEKENYFVKEIEKLGYKYFSIPVAVKQKNEGRDFFRIIRCYKILFQILRKQKYDIVHTNGYFADIIGLPVAKILGILHTTTCHGFISNDKNLVFYNFLDKIFIFFSDKIIAVSEIIKSDLERSGLRKSKIEVIQNAVQTTFKTQDYSTKRQEKRHFFDIQDNEIAVGYVGRLSEEKGVRYLIEAGILLLMTGELCRFLIIGEGPKKNEIEKIVKDQELQDKFLFIGFKSNVEDFIPAFDIFVLPSLTEGTPMALLEAMSFGIPVVATNVGGVPKIIETGVNGIIVNPADSKALSNQIKILIHDTSLRKKVSKEAYSMVQKKYNVNDWCRKIEKQYCLLKR